MSGLSLHLSVWPHPPPCLDLSLSLSFTLCLSRSCSFPFFHYTFSLSFSCPWLIHQPNAFALMGQINYVLLVNSYPVCVADKPVHISFSELKLGQKVTLVSCVYPPPLLSLSIPLSFPVSHSITVSASGLDNVKQTP